MTPERWEQIERLYHSALECEADEREPFLDRACAGDAELRREIASLLAHDGLGDSFIAAPALADAAHETRDTSDMWLMMADGEKPQLLKEGATVNVGGAWLYFQLDHKNLYRAPGPARSWQKAGPEKVTNFPESGLFVEDFQISRDGRQLLYSRGRIAGDIWIMKLGQLRALPL